MASLSFPAGRVIGIPIRVHASWFVVLVVVTLSVSGQLVPGKTDPFALFVGLTGALLLFGSVLLHELGHCVVARYFGIHVRQIQLFLFGGVAEIVGEPTRTRDELLIAAAGPFVSFALAFLFLFPAVLPLPPMPRLLSQFVFSSNLLLGMFNLVPAFPMDGGRILRAVLWALFNDHRRATAWAAGLGLAFAGGLVLVGVTVFVTAQSAEAGDLLGPRFGGVWIALMGLFLARSATQANTQARIGALLREGRVAELATRVGPAVPADRTLLELMTQIGGPSAAELLLGFAVGDERGVVGFVEPARLYQLPRERWGRVRVAEVMTPIELVPSIEADRPLDELVRRISETGCPGLVVRRGSGIHGYVSRLDLARWLVRADPRRPRRPDDDP